MTNREKRERVILGLECCTRINENCMPDCETCPYKSDPGAVCGVQNPIKDALELLKAQEPVEPAIGGNQNSCWYYICPICQLAIDKGDKYCRHCGRAVRWDE